MSPRPATVLPVAARVGSTVARHPSAHRLTVAIGALVVTDLVGGVLAVVSGVNTWSEAWGPAALLAAPAPMMIGQVLLTLVATGRFRRVPSPWAATAAVVLALACLVSVVSGFVDGGLANHALTGGLVAYQVLLLAVTATAGVLAGWRGVVLIRRR